MSRLLPLVNLSLLQPILQEIRGRGVDPEPVLEGVGLTEEAIMDGDAKVHVMVIHHLLEHIAIAMNDQTFLASVGLKLDPSGWPMIQTALVQARTLGDFLNIYVSQANKVSSSVVAYLEVRGFWAIFGERRIFRPTILPSQNDGFMTCLALAILRLGLGSKLEPSKVSIVVCDTTVLPSELSPFHVMQGDTMGFRIQFPSEWLAVEVDGKGLGQGQDLSEAENPATDNFLEAFRVLLGQQVGRGPLSAKIAAEMVSMSHSKLARHLSARGTDISSEIAKARIEFAKRRLKESSDSIGEIAITLGYSDSANFTRAFRRTVGRSPSEYRKNQTSLQ